MAERMKLRLFAPGMTRLHKVGLVGLYMTLSAFEENGVEIPGLEWELANDMVTLHWYKDPPGESFEKLISESFQIDEYGFFHFPGLERDWPMSIAHKHLLYDALLNTFLQFGPHSKKGQARPLTYEIDGRTHWIRYFRPIESYRHQRAASEFLQPNKKFRSAVKIVGWLYPGGIQRHAAYENTKLEEPVERALALLYTPIGALYFRLRSQLGGRLSRAAIVLPEVTNLDESANARLDFMEHVVESFTGTSPEDAALAFATLEQERMIRRYGQTLERPVHCQIVTFGTVAWNEKQKTRTSVRSISTENLSVYPDYELAHGIFKNRWQKVPAKRGRNQAIIQPEYFFISPYTMREIIAANVVAGRRWFHGLAEYMADKGIRKQLEFERRAIGDMVKVTFNEDRMTKGEQAFVRACHEALRRRFGQLGERARRERISFNELVRREYNRLRVALSRCKSADTLRETVLNFWARAGIIPELQEHWQEVWIQFGDKEWRKAKDLALLALVSYQSANSEEEEALSENLDENEEEGIAG